MSMVATLTDLLSKHRLVADARNRRWICACGKKTFTGGRRSEVVDVHEHHVAEAMVAAGVTPPSDDPRAKFLMARAREGGQLTD